MRFSQKPQAFLEMVCREVQEIGDFRGVMVALVSLAKRDDERAAVELEDVTVAVGDWRVDGKNLLKSLHEPIHDALSVGETQVHNDISLRLRLGQPAARTSTGLCLRAPLEPRPPAAGNSGGRR